MKKCFATTKLCHWSWYFCNVTEKFWNTTINLTPLQSQRKAEMTYRVAPLARLQSVQVSFGTAWTIWQAESNRLISVVPSHAVKFRPIKNAHNLYNFQYCVSFRSERSVHYFIVHIIFTEIPVNVTMSISSPIIPLQNIGHPQDSSTALYSWRRT